MFGSIKITWSFGNLIWNLPEQILGEHKVEKMKSQIYFWVFDFILIFNSAMLYLKNYKIFEQDLLVHIWFSKISAMDKFFHFNATYNMLWKNSEQLWNGVINKLYQLLFTDLYIARKFYEEYHTYKLLQ